MRHGQGWSEIGQRFGAVDTLLQVVVDAEAPLRQSLLRLTLAPGAPARRVRLTGWVEWLMGSARQERLSLRTGVLEPEGGGGPVLACTQLDHLGGQGGATAFMLLQPARAQDADAVRPAGWTCDRAEFFDAHGRMRLPQQPGGAAAPGLDACAALALDVELVPAARSSWCCCSATARTWPRRGRWPGRPGSVIRTSAPRRRASAGTRCSARSRSRRRTRCSTC